MTAAYYNENDPFAAAWLRELIKAGRIAPGDVDDRSIEDVRPNELTGYTQCHFFAGIGTWSFALRNAGWPDDRPVWTGSPPCQPFSAAGQQKGYDDDRHLAPKWLDLVKECRPPEIFGEQVASAFTNTKHHWIDDLQDALEAEGYATGAIVLPACGVGAPHIRQRGWFFAKRQYEAKTGYCGGQKQVISASRMGNASEPGLERHGRHGDDQHEQGRDNAQPGGSATEAGGNGGLADAGSQRRQQDARGTHGYEEAHGREGWNGSEQNKHNQPASDEQVHGTAESSPPHSLWQSADWLLCRDGRWRPVEPGTFPLVDGASARVGRLRGYGNGIQAQVAEEVIRAYMAISTNY